jgi:hypothetical protein
MGINNVNVSAKIDALMGQNIDAFAKGSAPKGPAPTPAGGAPDGIPTPRASASPEMAPRSNLGSFAPSGGPGGAKPDLSAIAGQGGSDATGKAKGDAEQSMKTMADMNAINMRFQTEMAVMQMQKGMNEAVAKTIKDIGTKVAQLAG